MKKKVLFFFILCLIQFSVWAQINIQAGYTVYPLKAPGFETFFNTYNEVNGVTGKVPFKTKFSAATGWTWKVGFKLPTDKDGVSFYYNSSSGVNHLVTHNTFEFNSGEKRNITLKVREWTTDVALGAGSNVFYVALVGSFTGRFNKLYSSYVFADGTESFGNEHNLNGVFSALRLLGGYGFEIGGGTKMVKLVGKMHKIYAPTLKDGSTYLDYYDDLTMSKGNYTGASSYATEYFPADLNVFTADQLASEMANNFVYINDRGWEYTLAIQVMLDFDK